MKTALSVVVASGLVALAGCNIFDPDQSVILPVTTLDAPATVAATEPITVQLTLQTGGCISFDRIDVQKMNDGARIVPWGTDPRKGNKNILCLADVKYEPHTVQVSPPFVNPYHIVVEQGSRAPLTATVQVQ